MASPPGFNRVVQALLLASLHSTRIKPTYESEHFGFARNQGLLCLHFKHARVSLQKPRVAWKAGHGERMASAHSRTAEHGNFFSSEFFCAPGPVPLVISAMRSGLLGRRGVPNPNHVALLDQCMVAHAINGGPMQVH